MKIKILISVVIALGLFIFIARKTSSTMTVEHTFHAPLDRVWGLWTDPEAMKKWWSPKDFTAPVIKSDFKEGGVFLYSMRSAKGEMFWNTGTYQQIIPQQKIVSLMSFSDETGRVVPGGEVKIPGEWPDQVKVTVTFSETEGQTRVSIQEEGIPLIMKLMAKMGWEQQFDKFDTLL